MPREGAGFQGGLSGVYISNHQGIMIYLSTRGSKQFQNETNANATDVRMGLSEVKFEGPAVGIHPHDKEEI